jgi:hypothetical protein
MRLEYVTVKRTINLGNYESESIELCLHREGNETFDELYAAGSAAIGKKVAEVKNANRY